MNSMAGPHRTLTVSLASAITTSGGSEASGAAGEMTPPGVDVCACGMADGVGVTPTITSLSGTDCTLPVTLTRSAKTQPAVSGNWIRYQGKRALRPITLYFVPTTI